jgi:hypothetical protein
MPSSRENVQVVGGCRSLHAVPLGTASNAQHALGPICTKQQQQQQQLVLILMFNVRDQLKKLGCRNDTLVIAVSDGTNSNLLQNLINF